MVESTSLKFTLAKNSTVKKCIEMFNKTGAGFCVVIDEKNIVHGVITDGDLRRGHLKISDINKSINSLINKKYFSLYEKDIENSEKIFKKNKDIKFIPIIDKNKKLLKICFDTEIDKFKDIPVIIMAGGEGKRLRPLTNNTPKPMLKIGNKPLLEIIINKLKEQGFKKFFISVNYQKQIIKKYFKNSRKFGVNIKFIEEKEPLGTLGALSIFFKKYKSKYPLLVLNSDLYTNFNFKELISFHSKNNSKFTIVVRQYEVNIPYGLIEIKKNKITKMIEKPIINNHVNSGIYVLDPDLKKYFKKIKRFNANEFINTLLDAKININPFLMHEFWIDIGNQKDLFKARSKNV